jgi:hypothetical protein
MYRFCWGLVIAAVPLLMPLVLSADTTRADLSGTWQMDASHSHVDDGRVVSLTIQDVGDKLKVVRIVHRSDGKDVTSQFTCPADGSTCEFDEGGHKAKVSMWYDGPALMILKSDGPKEDAVVQWKMQLAPDTNTLTLGLTYIDPESKTETVVFNKSATLSQK